MFGIFKSKTPLEKLQIKYQKLHEEAFKLSKIDRKAADLKFAEAEEIGKQIEELNKS
ncbi:MAG: Lacal_2735 family protein [Saprospiraceae bacterium]|nr:Lacal_2735 family protein [Bacteroidia bacterium]NNE13548.1 Lacal_2735 family protein [Saprospiraceae bacterium]NNL93076.1 Lacal_2735 family protein [Saprospiraceae bacterium]